MSAFAADNELTAEEKADGWKLLFNGKDHTGWKCNNDKPIATPIEDGCLLPYKSGGYVVIYEKPFGDFVLKCDVKWGEGGCNSGIFFRVEDPREPVHTGFEIQVASGTKVEQALVWCDLRSGPRVSVRRQEKMASGMQSRYAARAPRFR